MPSYPPQIRRPTAPTRSLLLLRFLAGCAWLIFSEIIASSAAQGIANRLNTPIFEQLIEQAFLLLLLLVGFALPYGFPRDGAVRTGNALLRRATSAEEWQRGAGLGWAMLLIAVLPMMLTGVLHPEFWLWPRSWGLAILSLATIAFSTLALEVAFRGYLFRRLIELIGPVAATFFLSIAYAVMSSSRPNSTALSVIVTFFVGVLLSMAYLRTYALWFGWGLHFGWNAAMGLVLGLPVAGYATYNTLVATSVTGPNWLTGGFYGPEGALLTLFVVLAAMIVLHRMTRNYAWEYTHAPIVAAGYPMTVAPPEAHNAMAVAVTAQPAPLVQILSTTSTHASTVPILDEHLRRDTNASPEE